MTLPLVLVTGGTGTLGRHVVARLREADRDVRVLSRHGHAGEDGVEFVTGDLATGEGLAAAVTGAGTIVHCASNRKGDAVATRNLVRATAGVAGPARTRSPEAEALEDGASGLRAPGAGWPHLVYISIVGVDRFSHGYFKQKLECERVIAASGLPWTILRATQFYELILKGARRLARLPVVPVPAGFVAQPVDSGEVADRLAELALGEPSGRVADMGSPEVLAYADLIRTYLLVTGRRGRPVTPVWIPGIRAIREGALVPQPRSGAITGRRSWPEFLEGDPGLKSLCVPAARPHGDPV